MFTGSRLFTGSHRRLRHQRVRRSRRRTRLILVTASLLAPLVALVPGAAPAHAVVVPRPIYGPYAAATDIDGRGSMDPDDRIKTNAYTTNEDIYLTCQDTGPSVAGSTIWDYTTTKYWIPDVYVHTGTTGFLSGVPRCLAIGIDGRSSTGSINNTYTAATDIDGRGSMNVNDRVKYNAYLAGSTVFIKCQDHGPSVAGDTVWDFTADSYWIPDVYVHTGTTSTLPGMPICSSIGIDGTSATNGNGGRIFLAATDLNGYHGKSLSSSYVNNMYLDGTEITVMCQAYGQYNYGGDAIWDWTADHVWVADYYVHTGSSGFVMGRCDNDAPSGGSGNRFLAETTLNGYHGKSLSASRVNDKYPGGSYITVTCQAYGEFNYGGSAVWDKTSDGLWVADYYVKTGYTDIMMTRCDNDPKPTSGPGNPSVPPTPPAGSVASSQIRDKIVNAVRGQLGTHEWGDNCNPYGLNGVMCGSPWCSIFASWAFRQGGISVYLPYSGDFQHWGSVHHTLRSTSDIRPGDLVLFGSSASASNHVGVVVDVATDGSITTIEGNFHNEVTEVGPYQPSQAATYHPGDGGIFAVVAPVNDSGDTRWMPGTNIAQTDPSLDQARDTPVCALDANSLDTPEYNLCIEPSGGTSVRAVVIADPSSAKAFGATVWLKVGGTTHSARCLTIYTTGVRMCATSYIGVTSAPVTADATVTANGSAQTSLHVLSMHVIGQQQTKGDYCGPAATQAVLATVGASVPSQDTIANEEHTTFYNFTIPTDIPPSLNSRISGHNYTAYFYANEGLPELVGLMGIKKSLDAGMPVILLINPNNLPGSWNIETGTLVRHYVVIYGYGGRSTAIADNVPFDLQTFNVWDSANNWTHSMNLGQLYDYTYGAEMVGTGSFVAIAATS